MEETYKHYKDLFNCIYSNIGNVKYNVSLSHDIIVGAEEVCEAIRKLDCNKPTGAVSLLTKLMLSILRMLV